MKTVGFTAAVAAASVFFSVASAEAASLSEQVQGTSWHFVSFTVMLPNGSPMHPYGPNPTGSTIFDRAGHFTTVISNPGVPKFASNNITKGTDAEIRAAWQGNFAEFGTYKVDEKSNTLIFHVEGTNFPNWIGMDIHDVAALTGNRMTWTNASGANKTGQSVLVWERVH